MFSQDSQEPLSNLPTCSFTWAGIPSSHDTSAHRLDGHDVDGVMKFAQCAKNPVVFYCLEEYESYYKDFFEQQHGIKNITVKSVESLAKECYEAKNAFIHSQADLISKIIKTHKERNTKRDLVMIKNLVSLLIIYKGGYALDTNVQPTKDSISLPAYSSLKVPQIGNTFDVWLLYSPAQQDSALYAIETFLEIWEQNENDKEIAHDGIIMEAIKRGALGREPTEYSLAESSLWSTHEDEIGLYHVDDLSLSKMYNNTHKNPLSRGKVVNEMIMDNQWKALELYRRVKWDKTDYNKILISAILNRNERVIQYLLEEKEQNHLKDHLVIINEILKKSTDTFLLLEELVELENKMACFPREDFDWLIERLLFWLIKIDVVRYVKLQNQEHVDQSETIKRFINVGKKNVISIAQQLINNNQWDTFNDLQLTSDELKDVFSKFKYSEKIINIAQHPMASRSFNKDYYTNYIKSAVINDKANSILGLSKIDTGIDSLVFLMLSEDFNNNSVTSVFIDALSARKKENPAHFPELLKELLSWSFNMESVTYVNFLIKALGSIYIDENLLKEAHRHYLEFDWNTGKFKRLAEPAVSPGYYHKLFHKGPLTPSFFSPTEDKVFSVNDLDLNWVNAIRDFSSAMSLEKRAENIDTTHAPEMDLSKSNLFNRRKMVTTRNTTNVTFTALKNFK